MPTKIPSAIQDLFEQPSFGTLFAIQSDDASQVGAGTASNPLRVNSHDGFDDLLRTVNKGRWHRLHLGPGQWYTKGCWAFPDTGYASIARSIHLSGEGPRVTSIGLAESPVTRTGAGLHKDVSVLWIGQPNQGVRGATVSDIGIDGYADLFSFDSNPVAGLVMYGAENRARNLKIQGLKGSAANALEAFGVLLNSAPVESPYAGGCWLDDIDVINDCPGSDYFTGIYAGLTEIAPRPMAQSVVTRCRVLNFQPGQSMGYSFNARATFRDCFASGVRYAFYNDTDEVQDVVIEGAIAADVAYAALNVVAVDDSIKRGISLVGSTFRFRQDPGSPWIGICLWDKGGVSQEFGDVLVENCRFIGPESEVPMTAVSAAGKAVRNVRLVTNSWPKNAVMNLSGVPKTAVVLTANRDLDGANLLQFGTPPIAKK